MDKTRESIEVSGQPASTRQGASLSTVSLFTGAGGLDIGLEAADFQVKLWVELDDEAAETVRRNRPSWRRASQCDVLKLRPGQLLDESGMRRGETDILVGGPPCQPFSGARRWVLTKPSRLADPRAQTVTAMLRAVGELEPRCVLIENVASFASQQYNDVLSQIEDQFRAINRAGDVGYVPQVIGVDAAEYGVPQHRRRVFVFAERNGGLLRVPARTHGPSLGVPFVTAWDAIGDLPLLDDRELADLVVRGKWGGLLPTIPPGENYNWHTRMGGGEDLFGYRRRFWSFLLKLSPVLPSWTLVSSPGPAVGPFHWDNRQLSSAEISRLQTFPDEWQIHGSARAVRKQLGNAVPCLLAESLGRSIAAQFFGRVWNAPLVHSVRKARTAPPVGEYDPHLLPQYAALVGAHADHPGPGKGPGALRQRARRPSS